MLKRLLLATALIAVTAASASALELECGAPRTLVGEDANDSNPVQRIAVGYSYDDHAWRVFHQLRSGAVVARQTQYGMTDASNSAKTQWQGRLLRQPWLFMIGEVRTIDGGFVYHEWMYDSKQGNRLVMQAIARCTARAPSQQLPTPTAQLPTQPYAQAPAAIPPPSSQPPPVQTPPYSYQPKAAPTQQPPAPQVAARTKDSVPIVVTDNGSRVHIDVLLGGQPIRMLLDTGATHLKITDAVAAAVLRSNQGAWQESRPVELADGSTRMSQVLLIREFRIGGHVLRNVLATVGNGDMLLGFPLVNSIAPFTIDTRAGELIWHTTRG